MFGGLHFTYHDKDGNYFIDRDPKYFKHILSFLRQGTAPKLSTIREDVRQDFLDEVEV